MDKNSSERRDWYHITQNGRHVLFHLTIHLIFSFYLSPEYSKHSNSPILLKPRRS